MPGDVTFTLHEAALLLPPLDEKQLRTIVRALGWKPAAWRRQHHGRGHPVACYKAADLFRLHAALLPWLSDRSD